MSKIGKVYITGAGPGDEGLITLKAVECLKRADLVVYDYLVNIAFLDYCKPECEKIYAGKKVNNHTIEQSLINELLVKHALEGKTIVRLKGGDPFVFGRGGEEALALHENNIPFEIIPGVTAGVAVPAYAGIPVTHRHCSSSVTFITGHETPDKTQTDINWEALTKLQGTLVFYMGVTNLPNITQNLIEHGMLPSTAVALIRWGTTSKQEIIVGTLDSIVEKVKASGMKPPALIVVGDVVNYREQLQWFEGGM
jgi:uroporphyrinogen III methyltransferase/synthase